MWASALVLETCGDSLTCVKVTEEVNSVEICGWVAECVGVWQMYVRLRQPAPLWQFIVNSKSFHLRDILQCRIRMCHRSVNTENLFNFEYNHRLNISLIHAYRRGVLCNLVKSWLQTYTLGCIVKTILRMFWMHSHYLQCICVCFSLTWLWSGSFSWNDDDWATVIWDRFQRRA